MDPAAPAAFSIDESVNMPVLQAEFQKLNDAVTSCQLCPRLVAHREKMAIEKRAAYREWDYWGKPVPAFGDGKAGLLIVGLAPAAHGANRTGRMFTGDRSGQWLFRALHRAGFANQPTYESADDGLELTDCYITAAVRCAPPDNKPAKDERKACRPFLEKEFDLLWPTLKAVVCLGGFAYDQVLRLFRDRNLPVPKPKPKFGHGAEVVLGEVGENLPIILGSYHPSQQNTFTGRLTEPMFDAIWSRAREILDDPS